MPPRPAGPLSQQGGDLRRRHGVLLVGPPLACARPDSLAVLWYAGAWELLFADDLRWVVAGTAQFGDAALHVYLWALLGTPFSWRKAKGGLQLD